jgi:tetratricopeptide (TPR) repeat protein
MAGFWGQVFWGRKWARARDQVLGALEAGEARPLAALQRLSRGSQIEVLNQVLRVLMLDDRHDDAEQVIGALKALHPAQARAWATDLAVVTGDTAMAIEQCQADLRQAPKDVGVRARLARLLLDDDRPEEALAVLDAGIREDPTLGMVRVDVLVALGHLHDARDLAGNIRDHAELQQRHASFHGGSESWFAMYREAAARHDDLTAELDGAEAVVVRAAANHQLSGRAGVNYRLLAQAAMVTSPRLAEVLELRSPEHDLARAKAVLAKAPKQVAALSQAAAAELRLGHLDAAERGFQRAIALSPGYFPALLGLAAVLDERHYACRAAARALPPGDLAPAALATDTRGNPSNPQIFSAAEAARRAAMKSEPPESAWAAVVADLPALTPEERAVVRASVAPLAVTLPAMAAAGATIRLLPVDVRSTDLPELADLQEERVESDHRALVAIGGLATHRLAIARILELIDTVTENAWVFAHEFAHMAFWYLPGTVQAEVEALYARALNHPHSCEQYQLQNIDEFFAVSYQHHLLHRHQRRTAPERDGEGVAAGMSALFERLGG